MFLGFSHHELQVAVLHAVAQVEAAEDRRVHSVVSVVTGPSARAEHGSCLGDVAADSPQFFALHIGGIVEEVSNVDIVLAVGLLNLLGLLGLAEVHVAAELHGGVSLEATESLVLQDVANGSALIGTDGNDLALVLNAVDNECKAVKLSEATSGNIAGGE